MDLIGLRDITDLDLDGLLDIRELDLDLVGLLDLTELDLDLIGLLDLTELDLDLVGLLDLTELVDLTELLDAEDVGLLGDLVFWRVEDRSSHFLSLSSSCL